jgi:hypothetical protein
VDAPDPMSHTHRKSRSVSRRPSRKDLELANALLGSKKTFLPNAGITKIAGGYIPRVKPERRLQ